MLRLFEIDQKENVLSLKLASYIFYVSMDEFIFVNDHQTPRLPSAFSDLFM